MILAVTKADTMWLGLSDSFWGSLTGAAISGIFAVAVFIWGQRKNDQNEKKQLKNTIWVIEHVFEKISTTVKLYLDEAKSKKDMDIEVRNLVLESLTFDKYLDSVDIKDLLSNTDALKNIAEFKSSYKELTVFLGRNNYGYITNKYFVPKNTEESGLSAIERIYNEMNSNVESLRNIKL